MRRTLLTFVVLFLVSGPAMADDWPSFGGTPGGTRSSAETLVLPVSESGAGGWTVSFPGEEIVASPVVAGDLAYICLNSGEVHALRLADGSTVWNVRVADHPHNAVNAAPLAYGGRLYVATMERTLRALDAATGATLWTATLGGNCMSSPVAVDGVIYVGSGFPETTLHAVDATSGAPLWSGDAGAFVFGAPAVEGGRVYVGNNKGVYSAFSTGPLGGALVGSFELGGSAEIAAPAATPTGVFLTVARQSKRFAALAPDLSSVIWSAKFENPSAPPPWSNPAASSPSVAGGTLLFVAGQRPGTGLSLFARDAASGGPLWNLSLGNTLEQIGITPSPLTTSTQAICATQGSAQLRVLDLATGADLAASPYPLSGPCAASPVFANGRIIVCTWNGTVHCFNSPNAPPPAPASGFAPAGGTAILTDSTTLLWDAVADPDGDTVTYIVRYDIDGDLIDYTEVSAGAAASLAIGSLPDNSTVAWAVRARDANGAASPFSATQTFVVTVPPAPPAFFGAVPADGAATLTWGASPSPDVDHYEAAVRLSGATSFGPYVDVGGSGSYSWGGLTNNVAYDFSIVAVDATALTSADVQSSVIPSLPVTLEIAGGGTATYPSVAAALAAAGDGDRVLLDAGDYGQLTGLSLPEGVTLAGAGPGPSGTRIDGKGMVGALIVVAASNGNRAELRDLSLLGAAIGADADGGVLQLRNVVIRACDVGVRAENAADLEVINVTIDAPTDLGIDLLNSQSAVRNTLIQGAGQFGLQSDASSAPFATLGYNNVVGSGTADYSGLAADANSISSAVAFLDALNGDYREASGSPNVDAGDPADAYNLEPYYNGSRINIGAFGNTPDATISPAPPGQDIDGDGILNADEIALGTDPNDMDGDTDGDGQSDAAEIGGDPASPLDTDGDGVVDALEPAAYEGVGQGDVLGFVVSETEADALGLPGLAGALIVIETTTPGATLTRVVTAGYATPVENTSATGGGPSGYTMPLGLLRFNVNTGGAAAVTVTIAYDASTSIPTNAVYLKFTTGWATFAGATGLGDGDNVVTLTLTDGGPEDADGAPNGVIEDPGGIAVPIPVAAVGATATGDSGGTGSSLPVPGAGGGSGSSGGGCFVREIGRQGPFGVVFLWVAGLLLWVGRRR